MHDIRMVRDAADTLREGMRRRGKADTLGPLVERAIPLVLADAAEFFHRDSARPLHPTP